MEIKDGQLVLLMKYSEVFGKDPIRSHMDVLKKKGFVWFGKFGTKPSDKTLNSVLNNGIYNIILHYSKGKSYLCQVSEVSLNHPIENYPKYYDELDALKNKPFKIYFKLTKITELNEKYLREFSLASTGEPAGRSLRNSMASIFILRKK